MAEERGRVSGTNRVMQRPWSVQSRRATAAAALGAPFGREEEEEKQGGENESARRAYL